MDDHIQFAIEAVQARREGRHYACNEIFRELEASGCSPARIRNLLAKAEALVPHPHGEQALRILKAAAKAARRGQAERAERLQTIARNLLNDEREFFAIVEEHRLSFALQQPAEMPAQEVRHGFALA